MPLNLYRRHYRKAGKCVGGHAPDSRTYEPEELRRSRKSCICPIYADGTLNRRFKRKNTGKHAWQEAKVVAEQWEHNGCWDQQERQQPQPEPVAALPVVEAPDIVSIEQAIAAFLGEHAASSAPNTVKKYRMVLQKLSTYSAMRGYVWIDQLRPIDLREFRQSWTVGPLTASKNMSVVKGFFEFALVNEWIDRNPARLVKAPRGRTTSNAARPERVPFSDDELRRMYHACRTLYAKKSPRRYSWTGEDLEDFISVSVYTGLRISDVATFHIDRLLPSGECHVRTTKNGRKVFTWVPDWLQRRLRTRAQHVGPLVFGAHATSDINVITDLWRRKLKRLWTLCGAWKERPTPHRFRHTFARILLEKSDVTIRDVAELLGDTEEVVCRHYSAWVPERQERLTIVLREAFAEKPTPKAIGLG